MAGHQGAGHDQHHAGQDGGVPAPTRARALYGCGPVLGTAARSRVRARSVGGGSVVRRRRRRSRAGPGGRRWSRRRPAPLSRASRTPTLVPPGTFSPLERSQPASATRTASTMATTAPRRQSMATTPTTARIIMVAATPASRDRGRRSRPDERGRRRPRSQLPGAPAGRVARVEPVHGPDRPMGLVDPDAIGHRRKCGGPSPRESDLGERGDHQHQDPGAQLVVGRAANGPRHDVGGHRYLDGDQQLLSGQRRGRPRADRVGDDPAKCQGGAQPVRARARASGRCAGMAIPIMGRPPGAGDRAASWAARRSAKAPPRARQIERRALLDDPSAVDDHHAGRRRHGGEAVGDRRSWSVGGAAGPGRR